MQNTDCVAQPCARAYVYTCHILTTTASFGCASSVPVLEWAATGAEGEADSDYQYLDTGVVHYLGTGPKTTLWQGP